MTISTSHAAPDYVRGACRIVLRPWDDWLPDNIGEILDCPEGEDLNRIEPSYDPLDGFIDFGASKSGFGTIRSPHAFAVATQLAEPKLSLIDEYTKPPVIGQPSSDGLLVFLNMLAIGESKAIRAYCFRLLAYGIKFDDEEKQKLHRRFGECYAPPIKFSVTGSALRMLQTDEIRSDPRDGGRYYRHCEPVILRG